MKVTTGPTEPVESVRGVRRLVPTTHVSRRRSVVVFAVLLVLTGLVGGLPELAGAPGVVVPVLTLLGILACLGVGALIRASIDATGDLPDDQLDERLVAERDGAYLAAYRLVATIFVLVAVTADALHARVFEDADADPRFRWATRRSARLALLGVQAALLTAARTPCSRCPSASLP